MKYNMNIDKSNKELWDIDASEHPIFELMFMLKIKNTDKINKELEKNRSEIRADYSRLSDYINTINLHPEFFQDEFEKSKSILRRYKLKKLNYGQK